MSESQEASQRARARAFESAGDESVYDSSIEEAKVNYGWAIDTYLEVRAFEEAMRICRKLIRVSPDVVRTRYTLLFLLVGLGRYAEARSALEDYVNVVRATGTRSFAIPRLQLLAHVTQDAEIVTRIQAILSSLGATQLGYSIQEPDHPSPELSGESGRTERWETLLPIALRDD